MTSAQVRAAGGVLWRVNADRLLEVAVVHRPRYDDWSLPKGKAAPGEHLLTCALREVKEETGYDAVIGRSLGFSRYLVMSGSRATPKSVHWWAMRCTGGQFESSHEVDRMKWLSPDQALRRMTPTRGRSALRRFLNASPDTRTLLLVRNGRAVPSSGWTGEEPTRPLQADGQAQADALAELLTMYQPDCVTSAASVRCVETVAPLAGSLELPVEIEPALSVSAHDADPSRTRDRVWELLRRCSTVVICAEHEVVNDLVVHVTGRRRASAGRGSTWALSLDDGRLAGVDYWTA